MRPRPAWLQENLAAVEITTNAPSYPHLKSLDWWLTHPYPACPCNVIAYDTWHWVRQHRRLPRLCQQPKGAGIKSDRRVVFAQIATELGTEAQTRFTPPYRRLGTLSGHGRLSARFVQPPDCWALGPDPTLRRPAR